MKKLCIVVLIVLLFCCILSCFVGCKESKEPIPFNARGLWVNVKDEFLIQDENRVRDIVYNVEFPDLFEEDSYHHPMIADDSYPIYRAILIKDRSHADEIFEDLGIFDFENRMIIVIIYSQSEGYSISLSNVEIIVDDLLVTLDIRSKWQTMPRLVVSTICLDKIDINTVFVDFQYKKWRD